MEEIIAKYDYAHGTEELERELQDDLEQCEDRFAPSLTLDGLKKIISTFLQKVCLQPFPKRNSAGYHMCSLTLKEIISVMKACKSEHKVITKEQCQELLFDIILEFITKGQGSTHYGLVFDDITKPLSMDEYIQGLRGDNLKKLVNAIKQQKFIQEEDMNINKYGDTYQRCIAGLIKDALGDDDEDDENGKHRQQDVHSEFLDLYIFFLTQAKNNPIGMINNIKYCQNVMWYKYQKKPYLGCQNVELYRRHLGVIKTTLTDESYPRNDKEAKMGQNAVKNILQGIAGDKSVQKALWNDVSEISSYFATCSKAEKLKKELDSFKLFIENNLDAETLKEDPAMFKSWAIQCADLLEKTTNSESINYLGKQVDHMTAKLKPVAGDQKFWIPILKGLLRHPTKLLSSGSRSLMKWDEMKKIWKWKENVEAAKKIVNAAKEANLPKEKVKGRETEDIAKNYGHTIKELFEQLKLVKVHHLVMPELSLFLISTLEKRSEILSHRVVEKCSDMLDFTKNQNLIPGILKRFSVLYFDPTYPWDGQTDTAGQQFLESMIEAYSDGNEVQQDVNDLIIGMLNYSMSDDVDRIDFENRSISFHGQVICSILPTFVFLHCETGSADILTPLIPSIFKMMDDDNETMVNVANAMFNVFSVKAPKLIAKTDDFDRVIQRYLETEDTDTLGNIYRFYPHNTEIMAKRFQEFMATLGNKKGNTHKIIATTHIISEKQPEIFTRENVNAMSQYLSEESEQMLILMVWDKISAKNPDHMLDQVDTLLKNTKLPLMGTHFIQGILSNVAGKHEKYLEPVLKWLMEKSNNLDNQTHVLPVYHGMRKLAGKYGPDPFNPYRKHLDQLKLTGDSLTHDAVSNLIDVLEGRSLETVSADVKQVKEDVTDLDNRVGMAEIVVGGVIQQVERHEEEIKEVKDDVDKVNKRVDNVEEDLGEVKEKVEEIDMKTMSNAPTWSRDVTKLLNPQSDNDWRLLASRLGYSNDDIRAWATQSDPCMALLSEWYATHKTREATGGVLNSLQEINRLDAAVIVENAMKVADDVVEDEEFEYASPPPVFLSYQWGHQNEVKLLRQHLEMAGYECWMDIGQMGGGDKLFEKIDAGIRGAKVVICCVSEKYAKSPNCNREVNLAVNLRKPMIPLQMEKIAWPPVGSMGPIFSEYLYIRFYSGGTGNKYWADAKFQELLMQLQFNNVMPDAQLIKPEYENWWIPVAEEIVIKQDSKTGNKTEKKDKIDTDKEGNDTSPDVFLSYQWGKQKQIQALYQRLTGLGFSCWMDIHQMGGGDSLYDKIDKGVRGCKVVVSSVTQKYALSANCRREVSLADALKKPIIPILLEEITWPPIGPMSMVFTQLLYINFCKNPDIQTKWTGKEFDELLDKLKEYVPDEFPEEASKKTENEDKGGTSNQQSDENNKDNKISTESAKDKPSEKEGHPQDDAGKEQTEDQQHNNTPIANKPMEPKSEERRETVEHPNANIATERTQSPVKQKTSQQSNRTASEDPGTSQNINKPTAQKKSSTCNIL